MASETNPKTSEEISTEIPAEHLEDPWIVEHFPSGPLQCNCVIIGDRIRREAMVVDPGGDAPGIVDRLRAHGLRCTTIAHTHTHFDHVGATHELQAMTGAKVVLHEEDLFLYQGLQMQLDAFGVPFRAPPIADVDTFLRDGHHIYAGQLSAGVIHTPGHTPGSLCFDIRLPNRKIILAGDTLFRGSIGRTDLWGGDSDLILRSIQQRIMVHEEDTHVIAGHGPTTTIGYEAAHNIHLR